MLPRHGLILGMLIDLAQEIIHSDTLEVILNEAIEA